MLVKGVPGGTRWSKKADSSSWADVSVFISYHYNDVIMSAMASQITSLTIIYSTGYSGPDQGKHQSSASLAFVRGIHRSPVNFPHKGPVTRKMLTFDDVVMVLYTPCSAEVIPQGILCISAKINLSGGLYLPIRRVIFIHFQGSWENLPYRFDICLITT